MTDVSANDWKSPQLEHEEFSLSSAGGCDSSMAGDDQEECADSEAEGLPAGDGARRDAPGIFGKATRFASALGPRGLGVLPNLLARMMDARDAARRSLNSSQGQP